MTSRNSNHSDSPASLSCAEFQQQLPDLFSARAEGLTDDPNLVNHLDTCENCTALVRDLQYIADQARQLLEPTHEPSDNVWEKIQKSLAAEPSFSATPHKQ
jgi:hypothetical protein